MQVNPHDAPSRGTPLLLVENLSLHYPSKGAARSRSNVLAAVDDVSFTMSKGETLGLVGESGSGKSSLGSVVVKLAEPTSGRLVFEGRDITHASRKELADVRPKIQLLFQDPYSSINPRKTAREIIATPLRIQRPDLDRKMRDEKVLAALNAVGLHAEQADRFPSEFSGGQKQRIAIARAIVTQPTLLVADEPLSALDVSIQAQIVNLLARIKSELGLTMLFISHDLALVSSFCDRIAVMYLGRIVEIGTAEEVLTSPKHPYTKALLAAVPKLDPSARDQKKLAQFETPSRMTQRTGCTFITRCEMAQAACAQKVPETVSLSPTHGVRCLRA